jgi:hypothetical protein
VRSFRVPGTHLRRDVLPHPIRRKPQKSTDLAIREWQSAGVDSLVNPISFDFQKADEFQQRQQLIERDLLWFVPSDFRSVSHKFLCYNPVFSFLEWPKVCDSSCRNFRRKAEANMAGGSLRRHQVIQQEARETLKRFLIACSELIPKKKRTHFRSDFPATSKSAEKLRRAHQKIARETSDGSPEIIEAILRDNLRFADAFMRLLQCTADVKDVQFNPAFPRVTRILAKMPARSDLDILRDALNDPFLYVDYQGYMAERYGEQPYSAHGKSGVREAAEALLQYLNMTDGPGPVHTACQVCGLLMIRKRGGRKYCSVQCSSKAWNYDARKGKLAANRKIHRERAARELRSAKTRKGV